MLEAIIGTITRASRWRWWGNAETHSMRQIRIRTVVFQENDAWCAQCLEYDIAVQAQSVPELREELSNILFSYVQLAFDLKRQPFEGIPPAPARFFEMYKSSSEPAKEEEPIMPPLELKSAPSIVPELKFVTAPV